MLDPELKKIIQLLNHHTNWVIDEEETWTNAETTFSPVTLLLNGLIVSGKPISYRIYLRRSRDLIVNANADDLSQETMLGVFKDKLQSHPDEGDSISPEYSPKHICLCDVTITQHSFSYGVPLLIVALSSIQAWHMGEVILG